MPVTKPHLDKRTMKGDTAPNYLWSYYNRVTKATAGESSVFEQRDKGEEMSSKTLSGAALSRSPRHFISRSHHHCSRPFFTKTPTKRLLSYFHESTYILLKETIFATFHYRFHPSCPKNHFLKRQTTDFPLN